MKVENHNMHNVRAADYKSIPFTELSLEVVLWERLSVFSEVKLWLGMLVQAFSLNTQRAETVDLEASLVFLVSSRPARGYPVRLCLSNRGGGG